MRHGAGQIIEGRRIGCDVIGPVAKWVSCGSAAFVAGLCSYRARGNARRVARYFLPVLARVLQMRLRHFFGGRVQSCLLRSVISLACGVACRFARMSEQSGAPTGAAGAFVIACRRFLVGGV